MIREGNYKKQLRKVKFCPKATNEMTLWKHLYDFGLFGQNQKNIFMVLDKF